MIGSMKGDSMSDVTLQCGQFLIIFFPPFAPLKAARATIGGSGELAVMRDALLREESEGCEVRGLPDLSSRGGRGMQPSAAFQVCACEES